METSKCLKDATMTASKMLTNQQSGFDLGKFSRVKDPQHAAESAGKNLSVTAFFRNLRVISATVTLTKILSLVYSCLILGMRVV